ncbi:MAG: efflux RND transporter periplasmic adaptor subunit [Candidatus Krumholzibacteriota bacterium]|nr:efflux RND transporter periplasmic adaptor subunit [Candidatus Krumholzibacteriota bacterium]
MKKRILIFAAIAVVIAVLVIVNLRARGGRAVSVQTEVVSRRDISMVISASGSIRPKRQVDVSARSMGKVTRVAVEEGDVVRRGQFLLQIDPIQLESIVGQLEASLSAARAEERRSWAQVQQAKSDLDRSGPLSERGYLTEQEVETTRTAYEVAVAAHQATKHQIEQYEANLKSARHNLDEVTIEAEMDGIVTRLNVEEGETAIMGTTNIPGTVLLTIADLSTIEAEVEVDETEVVHINLGDRAEITLDAFPDTTYAGEVTEIGNSPILSASTAGQQGVDFKVVITVIDSIVSVRPGLSADAEITVAEKDSALTIPIQSLTVRRRKDIEALADSTGVDAEEEIEGVFVVTGGRARFRPIDVGISSQQHFEVVSGLDEKEEVVSGNFRAIRDLGDGQRVKVARKAAKR